MSKLTLDSVEWKEFRIEEIFEIKKVRGKAIDKLVVGETPYISTSAINNGLINFVKSDESNISSKNCISIDPIGGKAFYHGYDFVGRGFSGASINTLYNERINEYTGLFIVNCIENTSKFKASYGYLFNSNRLARGVIQLPVAEENEPNWQFMEDYIKQERKKQAIQIRNYYEPKMLKLAGELAGLEEVEWKEFWLEDVCEIQSGIRLTQSDMTEGDRPFIGATEFNNGITAFVSNTNKSLDSNVLGVNYNGSVVKNFYHEYECVFSDDVKRLKVKDNAYQNKYVYLFLKQVILQQERKYAYGYKFNASRMKRQKIMLPVGQTGEPNYSYMIDQMKWLEFKEMYTLLSAIK